MKDQLGQERSNVRAREFIIAALFVALVGVGVWTVAVPALSESSDETKTEVDGKSPPETGADSQPTSAPNPTRNTPAPNAATP